MFLCCCSYNLRMVSSVPFILFLSSACESSNEFLQHRAELGMVVTASGELSFKCQLVWVKLSLGMGPFQTKMMVSSLCEDTWGLCNIFKCQTMIAKTRISNPCLMAQLRVIDNVAIGRWEDIMGQN